MEYLNGLVSVDPEVHSGTAVFAGTRVPVQTFLEYLEEDNGLNSFLEGFPSVSREQAIGLLDRLSRSIAPISLASLDAVTA